jgi:hypothetical protein
MVDLNYQMKSLYYNAYVYKSKLICLITEHHIGETLNHLTCTDFFGDGTASCVGYVPTFVEI